MEQKQKEQPVLDSSDRMDINEVVSDYLLKKGYVKALTALKEELQTGKNATMAPNLDKEHTSALLLNVP